MHLIQYVGDVSVGKASAEQKALKPSHGFLIQCGVWLAFLLDSGAKDGQLVGLFHFGSCLPGCKGCGTVNSFTRELLEDLLAALGAHPKGNVVLGIPQVIEIAVGAHILHGILCSFC